MGKGFYDFARKKFNPSQLGAIAASAEQYGGWGFTLIKGPPGTGKVRSIDDSSVPLAIASTFCAEMSNRMGLLKVEKEFRDL